MDTGEISSNVMKKEVVNMEENWHSTHVLKKYGIDYCTVSWYYLKHKGTFTLCRAAECNKMRPCCVANGGNNVDVNAVWLRQSFCMPRHTMQHEKSIGKMLVSSKVCRVAYDE